MALPAWRLPPKPVMMLPQQQLLRLPLPKGLASPLVETRKMSHWVQSKTGRARGPVFLEVLLPADVLSCHAMSCSCLASSGRVLAEHPQPLFASTGTNVAPAYTGTRLQESERKAPETSSPASRQAWARSISPPRLSVQRIAVESKGCLRLRVAAQQRKSTRSLQQPALHAEF